MWLQSASLRLSATDTACLPALGTGAMQCMAEHSEHWALTSGVHWPYAVIKSVSCQAENVIAVFIARLVSNALTPALTLMPVAAVVPWLFSPPRSITATFYKCFPVTAVIAAITAVAITVSYSRQQFSHCMKTCVSLSAALTDSLRSAECHFHCNCYC